MWAVLLVKLKLVSLQLLLESKLFITQWALQRRLPMPGHVVLHLALVRQHSAMLADHFILRCPMVKFQVSFIVKRKMKFQAAKLAHNQLFTVRP